MNDETKSILANRERSRAIFNAVASLPRLSTDAHTRLEREQRRRGLPPAIPGEPNATDADRWDYRFHQIEADYALQWAKKGELYIIEELDGNKPVKCPDCADKYAEGFRTVVFPYIGEERIIPRTDSFHLSQYTFQALHSAAPLRHKRVTEDIGQLERALKTGKLE